MTLIMSIVISITFLIVRLLPGDPILLVVGDRPTLEQIEKAQNDYGFNEPLHTQYISFLKKTISLDLGVSLRTKQPVLDEINKRFPATFELVFFSMLISIIVGLPMGIVSALKRGKKIDVLFRGFSYVGLSLPVFWLAMILQIVFFGMLNWFPLQGRYSGSAFIDDHTIFQSGFIFLDTFFSGDLSLFLDALEHIVLPGATMAFGVLGILFRITRTTTIDILDAPFFSTFKFYGFKDIDIIKKSGYKNTLIPISTVAGLSFGLMLGGTFLVESIFDWPGIGYFSVLSILTRDYPAVIGVTVLYSFTYIIINFFIDIFYFIVDPRTRV